MKNFITNIFNRETYSNIYSSAVNTSMQFIHSTINKTCEIGDQLVHLVTEPITQSIPTNQPSTISKNIFTESQKQISQLTTQIFPVQETPISELKEKTNKEFEKFTNTLSHYASLKFVLESRFVGSTFDQEIFSKIIQKHLIQPNRSIFKDYLELAGKNLSFYQRIKARILYTFSSPLIHRHTCEFLNNLLTHVRSNLIEKNPNDSLILFTNKFLYNFTKFFEIYNRLENELNDGKICKTDFSKKLEEAIATELLDKNMEELCKNLSDQIKPFIPKIKLFEELKQIPIIGYFYKALDWLFGNAIDQVLKKYIHRALDQNIQLGAQSIFDNHEILTAKITNFLAEKWVMPPEYDKNALEQCIQSPLFPTTNLLLEKIIPLVHTKLKKYHSSSLLGSYLSDVSDAKIVQFIRQKKPSEIIIYCIQDSLKKNITPHKCEQMFISTFENLTKRLTTVPSPQPIDSKNIEMLAAKQKLINNWDLGLKLFVLDYSDLEKSPEENLNNLKLQHEKTKSYINQLYACIQTEREPSSTIASYLQILNELLLQSKTNVHKLPSAVQNGYYESYLPIAKNIQTITNLLTEYYSMGDDPIQLNSSTLLNNLKQITTELKDSIHRLSPSIRPTLPFIDFNAIRISGYEKLISLGSPLVYDVNDFINSKELVNAITRISLRSLMN